MNNTFDLQRFGLLLSKHTKENARTYLLSLAVLAAILCSFLTFVTYANDGYLGPHLQATFYLVFKILSGAMFTSVVFSEYGSKKKAIPLLTLPVSNLERYLVSWIYSYVIFQVLYTFCFYLVDFTVLSIADLTAVQKNEVVNIITIEDSKFFPGLMIFTFVHSVFFLGAIFFQKLHFIKTGFVFFAGVLGLILFNGPLLLIIFGGKAEFSPPFDSIRILEGKNGIALHPAPETVFIPWILIVVMALILWVGAYFKLKEKEV
jgi:hypothetical protein